MLSSSILIIKSLKLPIFKVPKFSKQLKAIALTFGFKLSSNFSVIGLKIEDIWLSIQFCNFADINNLSCTPLKKQFIQVELKYNSKSVDIHEHLEHFYLEDNHILDAVFLKWYLKYCRIDKLDKEIEKTKFRDTSRCTMFIITWD